MDSPPKCRRVCVLLINGDENFAYLLKDDCSRYLQWKNEAEKRTGGVHTEEFFEALKVYCRERNEESAPISELMEKYLMFPQSGVSVDRGKRYVEYFVHGMR